MFDESEVKVVLAGVALLGLLLAAAVLAPAGAGVRCGTCVSQQSGSGAGPITGHTG